MDNINMHKVYGDRFTAEELNLIVNVINLLINGEDTHNRNFTTDEKTKLANLQFHPATHSASIIDETVDRHFMTSAERTKLALLTDGSDIDATLLQQVTEVLNMFTWDKSRDLTETKTDSSKWVLKATSDLQTVKDLDSYGHPQDGDGGAVFKTDQDNNLYLRRLDELGNVVYKKVNVGVSDLSKNLTNDSPLWGMFLRKDIDDIVKELITFEKGLISSTLTSPFFTSGRLGSGFKIWVDETGKTHAEFDKVLIRDEFVANKLTIADVTSVGGQILITLANMNCCKVDDLTDSYRCYFKTDSGTINNRFKVGDQAICQTFNSSGQKYYWRLVTAIGSDYIELSKTDCDGTSIPVEGDEIIQYGNRTDTDRQSAILISAYGSGPAIKQYAGIKSYSFVDCEKTVISDKYNKFTGDFYLETGESIATLLKIQEGLIYSEISSIRKEVAAKDNLLKNASFSADTLYWLAINEIKLFTVNGKLLSFNRNFYGNKNRTLKVVNDGSRLTIRVKNIGIKQLNENISKPAKVVLADGTTDNPNFYVSFQYKCTLAGTLKIGFPGTPLYFEQQLAVTDEYQYLELSGKWDLTGDFTLSFDGDMLLYDLSLRNDKLQDFALLTSSKFTQTDQSISAIVKQVNEINNTITNAGWLTESDKVKIWAMLTFGETNTTLESLFEVTANGIYLKSDHIDLTGKVSFSSLTSDLQQTYANDLSNAQLAAKNGIAQQLGFTNYAQLVENALVGKTLISGGYINSELIDVVTLLANKVVAMQGKFGGSIATPFSTDYTTTLVSGTRYRATLSLIDNFNYRLDPATEGILDVHLPNNPELNGTECNLLCIINNNGTTVNLYADAGGGGDAIDYIFYYNVGGIMKTCSSITIGWAQRIILVRLKALSLTDECIHWWIENPLECGLS